MLMKIVKPASGPERQTHSTVDTLELTPKLVASWKSPLFQRELKINAKVQMVTEEIKRQGGVVPGILTLGMCDNERYIVDGQHRAAAFLNTGLDVGYADVRICWFASMGDMAKEFVRINTALVRMRPDDVMRGLEPCTPALQRIRRKCGYVGYDVVRRSQKSPVISMSTFLRVWSGSRGDVPRSSMSSTDALAMMDETETNLAIEFIGLCFEAWHRDVEYARLWSTVNLTLCAWLFRRVVLAENSTKGNRILRMSREEFRRCLLSLSAEGSYLEFLVGRNMGDRDRAPAYARIKAIFQRRFQAETGKQIALPAPAWSHQ
jgi:hypothetical protein